MIFFVKRKCLSASFVIQYIVRPIINVIFGKGRALMQCLRLLALKVGDRGFEPHSGLDVSKKRKVSSSLIRKNSMLWGASVACSASDREESNFESCVWRAVSSYSSHHPQEVFLA